MVRRFLFICTGWKSTHGGIQTVNRRLAQAVAALGHAVVVAVPQPTREDMADAAASRVQLRDAGIGFVRVHKIVQDDHPEVLCGHAALTGDIESAVKEAHPGVRIVHFIHHDPEALEHLKEYRVDRERTREEKTRDEVRVARAADLVVCIGAKLKEAYEPRIAAGEGPKPKLVHLNVGIDIIPSVDVIPAALPEVHVVGRTDSLAVKGMDLFVSAAAMLARDMTMQHPPSVTPRFIIRGGTGEIDTLAERLRTHGRTIYPNFDIQVRPFTTDDDRLEESWRLARLLVMPSRAEGYGLVALEALSRGVPTIVSSECGVYRLLTDHLSPTATARRRFLWQYGESPKDSESLARLMVELVLDQDDARKLALSTRDALASVAGWDVAAANLTTSINEMFRSDIRSFESRPDEPSSNEPVTPSVVEDRESIESILAGKYDSRGIVVFSGRGEDFLAVYRRLLDRPFLKLDMLGLCLSKFRRDYGRKLAARSERASVRIALLDPAFPLPRTEASIASIREREENREEGEFRRKIAAYHTQVLEPYLQSRRSESNGNGLMIRLYRALPAINVFRVDDILFFGPYLLAAAEQETPTMMVNRASGEVGRSLFNVFMRHFDEIWNTESRYRNLQDVPPRELRAWADGDTF